MLKYKCLVLDHDDTVVQSMKTLSYPFFLFELEQFRPGETISLEDYILECHRLGFAELCRQRFHFTAEELKIGLGSVYPMQNESRATIRGIDVEKHLPTTLEISSEDIYRALREPVRGIIDAIKQTLEDAPPELSSDIMVRGITLTGGGAQLLGLDALIHSETGIPAHVCKDPLDAVVLGAGKIVDDPRTMRLIDAAKR